MEHATIENITVEHIQKAYGKKMVLKDIHFTLEPGKCTGIIGANGCGKSTLFSILAGVQKGAGHFFFMGTDLLKEGKIRSKVLGYVPQGTPLIEELSAYDNLKLWFSKEDLEKELQDGLIHQFGVDGFLKVPVCKMSGGMKKRLSIVCAVAHHPQIIIMDEPAAALDILCKQTISDYIETCKKEGKTVLLSTHEAGELELCDEIYVMKGGVLEPFQYTGNVRELVERIQ